MKPLSTFLLLRTTCSSHPIRLDLVTLVTFGKQYKPDTCSLILVSFGSQNTYLGQKIKCVNLKYSQFLICTSLIKEDARLLRCIAVSLASKSPKCRWFLVPSSSGRNSPTKWISFNLLSDCCSSACQHSFDVILKSPVPSCVLHTSK